ncbi:MAG: substrate-binding domain-containing protein, partial [Halanaerobiales bacterium]
KSAYTATEYLIKQGHRKITHITGDLSTETAIERIDGFKSALKKNNIPCREEWILEGDYSKKSGKQQMEKIIKMSDRPTALFFANDLMAFGAYETIYKYNYNIPEDFSIIGHNNIDITLFARPGLTTMDQPKYKLGQIAVRKLINMIESKDSIKTFQGIILENNIVICESVCRSSE